MKESEVLWFSQHSNLVFAVCGGDKTKTSNHQYVRLLACFDNVDKQNIDNNFDHNIVSKYTYSIKLLCLSDWGI